MSNYSSVIICWSGIDDGEDNLTRIAILEELTGLKFNVTWPCNTRCPDGKQIGFGSACELVAVTHWNNFHPLDLYPYLSDHSLKFTRRHEVQAFWKDENMSGYTPIGPLS